MDLTPPKFSFNEGLYAHVKNMKREKESYMVCDLELLGKGATGTTFSGYIKPRESFPDPIVVKELRKNKFCNNEFEALRYLREQMIEGKLPGYYVFMYGCFNSGNNKYIILEKADLGLEVYLCRNNINADQYLYLFYHIANAVSYLEELEFNHGDLWCENVLVTWHPGQQGVPEGQKKFDIKIIDYDSAYKNESPINHPSYGGADSYRTKFIVGYDLNRFFDSLIYSYESYVDKKHSWKQNKIDKALAQKKKGKKNVKIPSFDEHDTDDEEFDADNVIYPQVIIDFMYSLGPSDPNVFTDCHDMAGKYVKSFILDTARNLGIEF